MTKKRFILHTCITAMLMVVLCGKATALDGSRELTQYLHRIWQVQQGLPQATIYAAVQGEEGYLWLGTQRGLYRFDGVRFSTVDVPGAEPLAAAWIRDVIITSDGSAWVATNEDGLFRISAGVTTHFTHNEGLPSNTVNRLMRDKSGNIWACTSDGLAMIHDGAVAKVYQMQQGLSSNDIAAACEDDAGHIWVVCAGKIRLNILQGDLFTQREVSSATAGTIHDVMSGAGGKLWIATSSGLIAVSGENNHLYGTSDGLAVGETYRLMQSTDGTIWVGMKEGFARLKPNAEKFESYTTVDGLSQSTVYALAEDREGSLWVGTKHGLNQFLDGRTVPYTTSEGLPSNETGPILQDKAGKIWIGTFGSGVCRLDGGGGGAFSMLTMKDGLASDTVRAFAEGLQGELWVGTDRGVNRIADGKVVENFGSAEGLPSADVRCLLVDHDGNVWAGTAAGVAEMKVGEKKWIAPIVTPGEAWGGNAAAISAMIEVGDSLWVARENGGLLVIDGGIAKNLSLEGDPLKDIDAFYRDAEGLLWLGTRGGGLGLYDGHKVQTFSVGQGLFDDDLRGIVGDDQGRLWMACSKGIFSVTRADMNRLAGGMVKAVVSTPFSPTDGLRTIECRAGVQPGSWRMGDGRVWFSTVRGLISIDPAKLQRNLPPLPLVVEQLLVDGKDELAAATTDQTIGPGVKNVEFRYTGLSFIGPTRLLFRYQLEGFDKGWIDAGMRREAFYTNLPPGKYRFRVQGSYGGVAGGDTSWSEVKTPISLELAAYFYQRRWFWPLCGCVLLLSLIAAYQMRLREERRRLATIFTERGRIARELHDTLIQGFSGVTMEMQAFLGKLHTEEEKRGLGEIIRDAGACLREARQSIAGLRQLERSPTGFAEMLSSVARELTVGKQVRLLLKFNGSSRLPPLAAEVEYNLIRIVREAIANALRHADARTVEVVLDAEPGRIELEIRDDGRGFDPQQPKTEGHYGLIGMRERGEEIGAKVDVASVPRKGTVVRVILEAQRQ